MASRRDATVVAVGTAAVLLPVVAIGLVLGHRHTAAHASTGHAVSKASPSAQLALADPSLSPLPAPSVSPPAPVATVAATALPHPRSTPRATPPPPPPLPALPAFSGTWPNWRMDAGQTGYDDSETTLGTTNVSRLTDRWSASVGMQSSPTIANGLLYVSGGANGLLVYAAGGCGRAACDPVWTGDVGGGAQGPNATVGSPVAGADRVYVVVAVQMETWLYSYPARGCGSAHCAPATRQQLSHNTLSQQGMSNAYPATGPTLSGGVVYVTATNSGRLYAFDERGCGQPGCTPLWTGALTAGDATTPPSVDSGMVYVSAGNLSAFPAGGCGAASCTATWTAAGPASTPAASGGRVYVTASGTLRCLDGRTGAQVWSTSYAANSFSTGSPMVGAGVVLATAGSTVYALDASSGALRWTAAAGADVSAASPTGGDGVAYVDTGGDRLLALAVGGCGASTCTSLWSTSSNDGYGDGSLHHGFDGPAVAGGVLFLGQPDDLLRTFASS